MFIYRKRSALRRLLDIDFGKWLAIAPILITLIIYVAILLFAGRFRFTVFVYKWVPEWTTALTAGAIGGLIIAALMMPQMRRENKPWWEIIKIFGFGVMLIGLPALSYYEYLVWFFPEKTVSYVTEYDVTFPGPSKGKHGHCEAGLLIKDKTLGRWVTLCSSKEYLLKEHKQGMDGIYVVENVSRYGVRLTYTEFTWL